MDGLLDTVQAQYAIVLDSVHSLGDNAASIWDAVKAPFAEVRDAIYAQGITYNHIAVGLVIAFVVSLPLLTKYLIAVGMT